MASEALPEELAAAGGETREVEDGLTPDGIARLLNAWRPGVLIEMSRRRLWSGAPATELEDQFQDVALVLTMRRFGSEEHLRRALWTGLGFRARDFWKSARRRERSVGEVFDVVVGGGRGPRPEDEAII